MSSKTFDRLMVTFHTLAHTPNGPTHPLEQSFVEAEEGTRSLTIGPPALLDSGLLLLLSGPQPLVHVREHTGRLEVLLGEEVVLTRGVGVREVLRAPGELA